MQLRVQFLSVLNIFVYHFDLSHLSEREIVSQCDFDLGTLKPNNIEHTVFMGHYISSLKVCWNLVHFKTELFSILLSCENSLYFMDYSPLPDMWFINIFLQSVCCFLHFLPGILVTQSFWFWQTSLSIFLYCLCFCVVSKKLLSNAYVWKILLLMFSSLHVIAEALAFFHMIHSWVNFSTLCLVDSVWGFYSFHVGIVSYHVCWK